MKQEKGKQHRKSRKNLVFWNNQIVMDFIQCEEKRLKLLEWKGQWNGLRKQL